MEPIRVLIVDDEPLARQGLRRMLEEDTGVTIVGECTDGIEAVEVITASHPELIFLDVQMPEMDGFEVLEHLDPEEMPLVVFVTAYDQHALRAFQVHALDYLLKPIEKERFVEALDRAKLQARHRRGGDLTHRILTMLDQKRAERGHLERIMIKSGGRISFLRTEEIDWLEAQGDYVCLHCQGKKHLLRQRISDLEGQLSPDAFLRIHRSTIVNIAHIKEMQPLFHGEYTVLLNDGTRLTMSRSFRDKVFQTLTGTVASPGK
jgi:two-component system, LytTR family, response regulator